MSGQPELLAPAGSPEAGYAALHYGADAIYLGLKKFSARSDADNFTLDELADIVGYAHSLTPRRRVLAAVNTLVLQDELTELVRILGAACDIGVDAAIVQDLGVFRIVRRYFPGLEIHASTQMAVHNLEGARTLRRMGFSRAILARELSISEIHRITERAGIETEAFVHGTLCCSYSGMCLFSSFVLGRSGNRGKCAYLCRDRFDMAALQSCIGPAADSVGREPDGDGYYSKNAGNRGGGEARPAGSFSGLPFSMRDLCLSGRLQELRAAGVAALKIEGRKRPPLYVAAATKLYRGLLDGTLGSDEKAAIGSDLRTIFSRPWTELYADSRRPGRPVAGPGTVGHAGERIGSVEAVVRVGAGKPFVRFRTSRPLELHDGIQIEIPGLDRPFGFAIEKMRAAGRGGLVFEIPAGAAVEVALPEDGYPPITKGAAIFCSSSGAVKRRYRFERPKAGAYRRGRRVSFGIEVSGCAIRVSAAADAASGEEPAAVSISVPGEFRPAKDPEKTRLAVEEAFGRLGGTGLELGGLKFSNPGRLFIPKSVLNEARRQIVEVLERTIADAAEKKLAAICSEILPAERERGAASIVEAAHPEPDAATEPSRSTANASAAAGEKALAGICRACGESPAWSIKVQRAPAFDAFEGKDWSAVAEAVLDISIEPSDVLLRTADKIAAKIGRGRVRFALPPITREWEDAALREKIAALRGAGWNRWEVSNLSGWGYLRSCLRPEVSRQVRGTSAESGTMQAKANTEAREKADAKAQAEAYKVRAPAGTLVHADNLPPNASADAPDIAADWPVYAVNRMAAEQALAMGASRFALSPEDGFANMRKLLAEFGDRAAVIVYQDTPLMISESCAWTAAGGKCRGPKGCRFATIDASSERSGGILILNVGCRTVVIGKRPLCIASRLRELAAAGAKILRAEFAWRPYDPDRVRDIFRSLRAGLDIPGSHPANFDRGLE